MVDISRNVIPIPIVNRDDFNLTDADNASLASASVSFQVLDDGLEGLTVDLSRTSLNQTISRRGLT